MTIGGPDSPGVGNPGLADCLKERTGDLHRQAERSGIIADILRGSASRQDYVVLLRNLHPVYAALEQALESARGRDSLTSLAEPVIYRTACIERDLQTLWGSDWRGALPLLPAASRYVRRVEAAAQGDGARLYGHAYTRYLGDLNGGQVLRGLLSRRLSLGPEGLSFYDFPQVADLPRFRAAYREAINRAPLSPLRFQAAVEEGVRAFAHNIELSLAIGATRANLGMR
ncbi:heme oxygenase (biliverdin-producing) [Pelagibius sp.]|uniref:biliverdin-producing heme oxygenase n=1 Tax=Pelagibius sp. TaxID=1931238 RepID=UPI0026270F87|nr:biliverdin-producing heme oxygenase [Pelagibius sp.]